METNKFKIYEQVFGYQALPFPGGDLSGYIPKPQETLSKLGAVLERKEPNGTTAFCPVGFSVMNNGNIVKTIDLINSTINVTMSKNIQKTPLVGRQGSVKELIQINDYRFTIQGVVVIENTNGKGTEDLPEDALADLHDIFVKNEPLRLENAFAEIFIGDDNNVIIESINFPNMKGITGAQAYTITVSSDSVLTLEDL